MSTEAEVRPTLELRLRLTNLEANLLRTAMSRGSGEDMSRKAAKQFFNLSGSGSLGSRWQNYPEDRKPSAMPKAYEFHPIADLFPLMAEAELNELAEDIKANGLKIPILLYEGKILDGRNRYLACKIAGVRPLFHHYKGENPLKWSLSLNLRRRHLTTVQRAAIAAELATLGQGARTDLASNEARLSQQEAADLMKTSRSSTQKAAAVRAADPEIHEKMKAGEFPSIADAERAASAEVPSQSNGNHTSPAPSNVTPFSEEPSRPISEEDKCIQQFKNLIKDLSKEFKTTSTVIRSYLRRYLSDYRR